MKQICTHLISGDGGTSIPIEDISRFTVFHKSYENGLKIKAYINPELCTVIDSDTSKIIKEGKYKDFTVYEHDIYCAGSRFGSREKISREINNSFIVLGKYNKCRNKLMAKIKKDSEKKVNRGVVMTGLNSGYATNNSYLELKMSSIKGDE